MRRRRCRGSTANAAPRTSACRPSAQIHQLEARLAALKQLQENVQTEGKIQPWLDKHELGALPRLWKKLHVEAGWEAALEAVLRERLAALEVSNLDWVKAFATDAPPAKLAFYAPPAAGEPPVAAAGLRPVLSLVRIDDAGIRAVLNDWLGNVYVADDVAQALATRATAGRRRVRREGRSHRDAGRRAVVRGRFRAGRDAGPPAGNREPRAPGAGAGAARRRGAHRRRARGGRAHAGRAGARRRARRPTARRSACMRCRWTC
jgi:hypothetical protein